MTTLFDYQPSARELAARGMAIAAAHADAVEPRWNDRAFAMLQRYAAMHREFMTEDARCWAHANGLPMPPDKRAWGSIATRAIRDKIIVRDRFELTRIPPAHATPRPVWRSRILGGIDL